MNFQLSKTENAVLFNAERGGVESVERELQQYSVVVVRSQS